VETVGAYRLLRQIGEGGMGVVHLALAPDGSRVAVKILRPQVIGDGQARHRLEREVAAMRRVRSPRVAECVGADPWGDPPYVVTRYVAGLSLTEYVAEYGPLGGAKLHRFAAGTAEALAGVHAAGVLHRDIKPSNVLIDRQEPVLIDFGLAMSGDESRMTHAGWVFGTPAYLAPEVVLGDAPTPAVDVHGWAATVAFAATGHSPYGSGPSVVVLDRIRRGDYSVGGVPQHLTAVLRRCLDPHPHQRPTAPELCGWLDQLGALPSGRTLAEHGGSAGHGSATSEPSSASISSVGHPWGEPSSPGAGHTLVTATPTAARWPEAPRQQSPGSAGVVAQQPGTGRAEPQPGQYGNARAGLHSAAPLSSAPAVRPMPPSHQHPVQTPPVRQAPAPHPAPRAPDQHAPGQHPAPRPPVPHTPGQQDPQASVVPGGVRPVQEWSPRPSIGTRLLQRLAGLASGAAVAGAVALAPYATTLLVGVLLVAVQASFSTADRRRRLEARRGPRGRDGLISVLVWPVRALWATPLAMLACVLSLTAALALSGLQAVLTPGPGDGSTLPGGAAFAALLWFGPFHGRLQRAGRSVTRALLSPPAAGVVTVLVLSAIALTLLLVAAGTATGWAPWGDAPWRALGQS
jgi:serine/threonine protein kinase